MYLTIIVAICAYNVDPDKYKGRWKMWVKPWILCRKVKEQSNKRCATLTNLHTDLE